MARFLVQMTQALILLAACAPTPVVHHTQDSAPVAREERDKATVIIAVDLRERTPLRDVPQIGDVLFRRLDDAYPSRAANDFDFGTRGSVGGDWQATLGGTDSNREPQLFTVEPGTYVIEKINIGANASTVYPGYDVADRRATIGLFSVQAGDVVNLGQLVVHMVLTRFHAGYFAMETKDDTESVRQFLARKAPHLAHSVQTRPLEVKPKVPFEMGPARS